MKTERHLLITISCGDERCGFCVHRSVSNRWCTLFNERLAYDERTRPAGLVRCQECLDAEEVGKS